MDTLTIQHQDGDIVYRLERGGYAVDGGAITVSVETVPLLEDGFPENAKFSLADVPIGEELREGRTLHARSLGDETVEGRGVARAYFSSHADDVALRWTVRQVAADQAVFALHAEHDDVDYYDERARRTTTTGLFTLARRPRRDLWAPV